MCIRDSHKTPVLTSSTLNEMTGAEVFLKCENFQRMGAYKMRGASHALSRLSDEQLAKGVVTHLSLIHIWVYTEPDRSYIP